MKLYKLTFMEIDEGKIGRKFVRFERNKTDVKTRVVGFANYNPERKLIFEERIDVPEAKDAFIDWLNETIAEIEGTPFARVMERDDDQ